MRHGVLLMRCIPLGCHKEYSIASSRIFLMNVGKRVDIHCTCTSCRIFPNWPAFDSYWVHRWICSLFSYFDTFIWYFSGVCCFEFDSFTTANAYRFDWNEHSPLVHSALECASDMFLTFRFVETQILSIPMTLFIQRECFDSICWLEIFCFFGFAKFHSFSPLIIIIIIKNCDSILKAIKISQHKHIPIAYWIGRIFMFTMNHNLKPIGLSLATFHNLIENQFAKKSNRLNEECGE